MAQISYVMYCDEAWTDGDHRWRLYGGCLLKERDRQKVTDVLNKMKGDLGLKHEMKWHKVSETNQERFGQVVCEFIRLVDQGCIKLRLMYHDRLFKPKSLTPYQKLYGYYILYYYFAVMGFGLQYHGQCETDEASIHFFPDILPDDPVKRNQFKTFMESIHRATKYRGHGFRFQNVADVDSRNHVLLQCVDVIIGSAGFKLNDFDKKLGPNRRKLKTTKAKIALYKTIRDCIADVSKRQLGTRAFGYGVSTSYGSDVTNRWRHKIRQWRFVPRDAEVDRDFLGK
jgi:hypothetical protein